MYIPEWEIEETLARNPGLLGVSKHPERLELIERQKYLKDTGRYVDLLFKKGDAYLIVEIKSTPIDQKSVVTDQLLEYKRGLARELGIPEENVTCMLTTLGGFSEDVKTLCKETGVITRKLDPTQIIDSIGRFHAKKDLVLFSDNKKDQIIKILRRRGIAIHIERLTSGFSVAHEELFDEVKSVNTLLKKGVQDCHAKEKIARSFVEISKTAPIRAHEIGTSSNGKLTSNRDMWFWLFYSVMDRRANAATFVNAKKALQRQRMFHPFNIVKLVKDRGEKKAINKITTILEHYGFPLLNDRFMGKRSFPKSIIDSAKFMSNYDFNFATLYRNYVEAHGGDLVQSRDSLWNDLKDTLYGVGPRIASQFIRGMVLKGSWKFPLDDNKFLEKCRFNVRFAGRTRLCLIEHENKYYEQLGKFADNCLDGNRGIIAHVLWYIRKRYCNRSPRCDECPVSGFCIRPCSTTYGRR